MRLSITIIKSKPNKNGSYGVKIMLSHNQRSAYLSTPYKINSLNEWDGKAICSRPDADYLNSKLYDFLHRCEEVAFGLDYDNMTINTLLKEISAGVKIKTNMERKSQRDLYHEKREKYYDFVIKSYQQGMTIREIAKLVPLSKSTVQRWADEHLKKYCSDLPVEMPIPRTVGAVSKQLKAMNARITELELRLEVQNKQVEVLKRIIGILKDENLI